MRSNLRVFVFASGFVFFAGSALAQSNPTYNLRKVIDPYYRGSSINHAPVWQTSSLPNGVPGNPYSTTVEATDSDVGDTVSYSVDTGSSLPSGLSLNGSTGEISGTPTDSAGQYNFTLVASDGHAEGSAVRVFALLLLNEIVYDTAGTYDFVVPLGVTSIDVKMWGGGGSSAVYGGAGGYTAGTVAVTPEETIKVEVGSYRTAGTSYGGGRAAIWRGSNTSEVLVAGGGGAHGSRYVSPSTIPHYGGAGGGTEGQPGEAGTSNLTGIYSGSCTARITYAPGGGTQDEGGIGGTSDRAWCVTGYHLRPGATGARILGGASTSLTYRGGTGGNGYYGGGQGSSIGWNTGSGGGGSGFVASSGVTNGVTIAGDRATPGNASDPDRGTAGNPGTLTGKIILRY